MMRAALLILVPLSAFSADEALAVWSEGRTIIKPACERYIKQFAAKGQQDGWKKKIAERIAQRIIDKGGASNEDAELQAIALDWATDNEEAIRSRDKKAMLIACFWFQLFTEKGIAPPPAMRDRITKQNFQQMAAELDQAVVDASHAGTAR